MLKHEDSLTGLCAALCRLLGIHAPRHAAPSNRSLLEHGKKIFGEGRADRLFLYNPDAIGTHVSDRYEEILAPVTRRCDLAVPFCTVMPSVTPVCFASFYTGTSPEVHGIQSYTKPVVRTDSLFDAALRAGLRPAMVSTEGDSLSMIFLERNMDYFIYPTLEEVNAKAEELIQRDEHDIICVYNGNYDATMHRFGPHSPEALEELKRNVAAFARFSDLIDENWSSHRSVVGFAMDHGCHDIDGGLGSHGLAMEEDLFITHFYRFKG